MENKVINPSELNFEEFDKEIKEYIVKLSELRKEGSEKIKELKYQIKNLKLRKNIDSNVKAKIIADYKGKIEKAKVVEASNKEKVNKLIKEAITKINENYKPL